MSNFSLATIISVAFLAVAMSSCSEYEQVLRSKDMDLKQKKAQEYFEKEQYTKANTLFQEVLQYNRTSKNFEDIYYKYAMSFFYIKNYYDAALYFNSFASSFPKSSHLEEANYLAAKCYDLSSPRYVLDQKDSKRAIDAYTNFKLNFPNSHLIPSVDSSLLVLQKKLETKEYESARLYYKIGQYKAAAVYFDEMQVKYPNSKNIEEYRIEGIKSKEKYADNSTVSKRIERYNVTLEDIQEFLYNHRDSENVEEVNQIKEQVESKIKEIEDGK